MATKDSMAIRINQALDEIEGAIKTLKQGDIEEMPRSMQDRDMLRVIQFEAIARHLGDLAGSASNRKNVAEMFEASMEKQDAPLKGKPKKE